MTTIGSAFRPSLGVYRRGLIVSVYHGYQGMYSTCFAHYQQQIRAHLYVVAHTDHCDSRLMWSLVHRVLDSRFRGPLVGVVPVHTCPYP